MLAPNIIVSKIVESGKRIRKKAKKCERQTLENLIPTSYCFSDLNNLLNNVYNSHRPKQADYVSRRDLIRIFNEIAEEIYGYSIDSPVVEPYGSFVMDMFSAQSDLDLSINFRQSAFELPREQKIKILQKFANKFHSLQRRGHVSGVESILTARVPIVKVTDQGFRIECDLSVENRDGILKSQFIHMISAIDDRFQKLSVLVKLWAKANEINSARDRTLNSLSIISLVAFHLQTRSPPILPPFSFLFKGGVDPVNVRRRIEKKFLNWGKKNTESLGWLFVTLLVKLKSVEKLWRNGLCASVYAGVWISKTWDMRVGSISIEDFTNQSQNVARAVGKIGAMRIYCSIQSSITHLVDYLDGKKNGSDLGLLLFGGNVSTMRPSALPSLVCSNPGEELNHHPLKRSHWEDEDDKGSRWKRMRCGESSSSGQVTSHFVSSVLTHNPLVPISCNVSMKGPSILPPTIRPSLDEDNDHHPRNSNRLREEDYNVSRGKQIRYGESSSYGHAAGHFISSVFTHSPLVPISGTAILPGAPWVPIYGNAGLGGHSRSVPYPRMDTAGIINQVPPHRALYEQCRTGHYYLRAPAPR